MRIFGLIAIVVAIAIAVWMVVGGFGIKTPTGETGDAKESYRDMLDSAESAADALKR